ncbi:dipeptidase [Streptomyces candidus]|uniref:Microsomal dipeptidase-like Zn-dependent dipeptidase n=1 Tax=Streptomyces candidus TaxID=67283 RepID=A0A7X0HD19_9ACTN|nr:dipeptidase [Streptomyces candidus]MBB6435350.1 microsomal dipeptidase-like Zn-dependent dipeptidase [Streptomyces candidus]GHH47829.1 dipeptidase [Streptomyces candidus]
MALIQDDPHAAPTAGPLDTNAPAADAPAEPEPHPDQVARARALLAAHPVADGYNGLARALRSVPWSDVELGESSLDTDIPRLRAGGVGAQFWSLHSDPYDQAPRPGNTAPTERAQRSDRAGHSEHTEHTHLAELPGPAHRSCPVSTTLEQIDRVRSLTDAYPEGLRLALSSGEIADARSCGRVASLLGPARAPAIGDSLGALRTLYSLGVRCLTLTGVDWAPPTGLTRFGEEVVREMNRLGMLADLSGTTAPTAHAALTVSRAPVIFTHTGAAALNGHPANVPDDVLTALHENGGLCMVPLATDRTGPELRDVADHLDHIRSVAGPACVGLSGMYDTGAPHPAGLADTAAYPLLIAELLERGWPESDLARLTWGNLQRVLRDVELTSKTARQRRRASTARIEDLDG